MLQCFVHHQTLCYFLGTARLIVVSDPVVNCKILSVFPAGLSIIAIVNMKFIT